MPKIKNNPTAHLRRSDLASCGRLRENTVVSQPDAKKHERDFMTASIDEGFYIDFSPSSRLGLDHKNRKR